MTIWFPFKRLFERTPAGGSWSPPAEPEEAEPAARLSAMAAPVHVLSGAAVVRVAGETLIVERPGEPDFERPVELVSALHIHGWATITSPAVARLAAQGTPVLWRGVHGYPICGSQPLHAAGLDIRRAQYRAQGGAAALDAARRLVAAKIVNMRGLTRRRAPLAERRPLAVLAALAKRARAAKTRDALLGLEGSATAIYFAGWTAMLTARADGATFEGRTRRPPRDSVNAMLSYAYGMLAGECLCAAAGAGLDPRLGVYHQPRAGRAALALDLMEPFRPIIADQAVVTGFNTGQIDASSAEDAGAGWRLTETGRRTLIDLIEKRLAAGVTLPGAAGPASYRDVICRQAAALAASLMTGEPFDVLERP